MYWSTLVGKFPDCIQVETWAAMMSVTPTDNPVNSTALKNGFMILIFDSKLPQAARDTLSKPIQKLTKVDGIGECRELLNV